MLKISKSKNKTIGYQNLRMLFMYYMYKKNKRVKFKKKISEN
jgi:hypothetical protein